MNKKINNLLSLPLLVFLSLPLLVFAADTTDPEAITKTIVNITNLIVTISTALAILMYVVGGFLWMSDAGSTERVKMAKSIIVSTTIGLVIILMAAAIASIVNGLVVR